MLTSSGTNTVQSVLWLSVLLVLRLRGREMRGGKTVNRTPHTVSRLVLTFVADAMTTACAVVTGGALGASRKLPATLDALCQLPGYVKGNGTVVRFRASDGTELVGATVGRGRVGVVLANSWSDGNGRICNWVAKRSKLINALVGSGYRVLLFDYRREGSRRGRQRGHLSRTWLRRTRSCVGSVLARS